MKKTMISLFMFSLVMMLSQGIVFAEEIYQDENGVWRNRPTSGEILSEGAVSIGEGTYEAAKSGLEGFIKLYSIPFQAPLLNMQKDAEQRIRENELARQERQRIRFEQSHVSNASSYERFDPATAGEAKSEWEFFDDPRDKKN